MMIVVPVLKQSDGNRETYPETEEADGQEGARLEDLHSGRYWVDELVGDLAAAVKAIVSGAAWQVGKAGKEWGPCRCCC